MIEVKVENGDEQSLPVKDEIMVRELSKLVRDPSSALYKFFAAYSINQNTGVMTAPNKPTTKSKNSSVDSNGTVWAPYVEQDLLRLAQIDSDFSWYQGGGSWKIQLTKTDNKNMSSTKYNIYYTDDDFSGLTEEESKKYVVKDIYRYSETLTPAVSIGTASLKKSNGFNFYVIDYNSFKVTEVIKESL